MYGKPVDASGSKTGAGVLLPGKTGLLLDDAGPSAIAAALRLLIDDPELRAQLGSAAAEHAQRSFDPARNARAVEDVYDTLLGIEAEREQAEPVALAHA
jgi:glycosyltransferase involved in cell wall biosynthesis